MADAQPVVWLKVTQAAARAQVGKRVIYRACAANRLRHAVVGNRRDIRILATWLDEWLVASSTPIEIAPRRAS